MDAARLDDLEARLGKLARVLTGEPRLAVSIGAGGPRVEHQRFVLPSHADESTQAAQDVQAAQPGESTEATEADEDLLIGYLDLLAARWRHSAPPRLDLAQAGVTGRIAQAVEDRRVLARLVVSYPGARRYVERLRAQLARDASRRWGALSWSERLIWTIERTLWGEPARAGERDAASLAAALHVLEGPDGPLAAARASRSTGESVRAAQAIVAGVRSLASRGANNMMQSARPPDSLDDETLARELDDFGAHDDTDFALTLDAAAADAAAEALRQPGAQALEVAGEALGDATSAPGATLSEADAAPPRASAGEAPFAKPVRSIPLTTAFDVVTDLTGSGDATAWRKLRALARAETGALKAHLERVLKADELTHWKREQERGEIDRAALARLAASRGYRTPFRVATHASGRDAAVTLLLDLSGSMAGRKIELARLCAAALTDALMQLGFDCEVLGYSSVESPDMRAQFERTRAAGADLHGFNRFVERLDLRVFKRFDARDSNAASGLAAIECGHENPDGEALAWAAARLMARKARRRLLFVLSDGYPSTSDGDPAVLRSDLHARVAEVAKQGIELVGIGIQDDAVEAFYPQAVVVRKLHELPAVAFAMLSRMLALGVRQPLRRG
ncbi:cobaltochelatase CobT-related protein [Paraburkholderia pallida]|uniref:Cobalamin biosynthesis protein CobT n=1 Tax=Paraburkholderia pallida TaxID=2547399 RepID=A0A4V1B0L4_9BURK|nr:cobalamin biosynthesis protein CobT [Paraburkholderia pallida]QBR03183.1 cobalamin biosynthesis protein CobT [Paraburkholderia pallida]